MPRTLDFRRREVRRVPGAITIAFGFDVEGEATWTDSATGEYVADTGPDPVLLSRWLAETATAADLAPVVDMLMEMAMRDAAGVIDG